MDTHHFGLPLDPTSLPSSEKNAADPKTGSLQGRRVSKEVSDQVVNKITQLFPVIERTISSFTNSPNASLVDLSAWRLETIQTILEGNKLGSEQGSLVISSILEILDRSIAKNPANANLSSLKKEIQEGQKLASQIDANSPVYRLIEMSVDKDSGSSIQSSYFHEKWDEFLLSVSSWNKDDLQKFLENSIYLEKAISQSLDVYIRTQDFKEIDAFKKQLIELASLLEKRFQNVFSQEGFPKASFTTCQKIMQGAIDHCERAVKQYHEKMIKMFEMGVQRETERLEGLNCTAEELTNSIKKPKKKTNFDSEVQSALQVFQNLRRDLQRSFVKSLDPKMAIEFEDRLKALHFKATTSVEKLIKFKIKEALKKLIENKTIDKQMQLVFDLLSPQFQSTYKGRLKGLSPSEKSTWIDVAISQICTDYFTKLSEESANNRTHTGA